MWFTSQAGRRKGYSAFPPGRGYDENGAPGWQYMLAHLLPVILATIVVIVLCDLASMWLSLELPTSPELGLVMAHRSKPGAIAMEKARLVAVLLASVGLAYAVGAPWSGRAQLPSVISVISWPWLSSGALVGDASV